ncbi:Beta-cubebene synthase [Linum perenne]
MILTKIISMLSLLDDTFDNFGTYEEVQILTEAIQRFNTIPLLTLPRTIKKMYRVIIDLYDEIEMELGKIGHTSLLTMLRKKFERSRKHVSTSVQCYMKENNVSEEEAIRFLWDEISEGWKDIVESCQKPNPFPVALTDRVLNFARSFNVIYENGDPRLLKSHIASLFAYPISLDDLPNDIK